MHSSAAKGIDTEVDSGAADGLHIDDVSQILDIGCDVVVLVRGRGRQSFGEGHPLDAIQIGDEELISLGFDPGGNFPGCWAAVRRIVFEATEFRRVM